MYIVRYWSEITTFSYHLAFNALVEGDPLELDNLRYFWWMSCRMARLQYGAKIPKQLKLKPPWVGCTHVTDDRHSGVVTTRSSAPRCDTSYLMPKGVMMFICWLPLYSRNIRRRADVFDDLARSICSTRQANGGRHVPHWVVNCPTEVVSCIRSLRCASSRFMLRHRASTSATIRRCIFEGGFCPTYRILYS